MITRGEYMSQKSKTFPLWSKILPWHKKRQNYFFWYFYSFKMLRDFFKVYDQKFDVNTLIFFSSFSQNAPRSQKPFPKSKSLKSFSFLQEGSKDKYSSLYLTKAQNCHLVPEYFSKYMILRINFTSWKILGSNPKESYQIILDI